MAGDYSASASESPILATLKHLSLKPREASMATSSPVHVYLVWPALVSALPPKL